jgi:hypothetical protein
MRRRSAASAALGVAVLALAGPAAAQAAAPGPQEEAGAGLEERLATGLEQFQDLDYREAIATLGAVRRDPAATRVQKVRALELIGISHLILDEKVPAAEAFEDLLTIDPGYQLAHDDGSPKIREFYAEVKRKVVPAGATSSPVAVRLEHTAPNEAVAGREVEIETVVRAGVEQVVVLVLRWRRRGVFDYQQAPMRRTGGDEARWRARFVPPASPGRYAVDYYLEAVNAAGGSIGRIAGPARDPGTGAGT